MIRNKEVIMVFKTVSQLFKKSTICFFSYFLYSFYLCNYVMEMCFTASTIAQGSPSACLFTELFGGLKSMSHPIALSSSRDRS